MEDSLGGNNRPSVPLPPTTEFFSHASNVNLVGSKIGQTGRDSRTTNNSHNNSYTNSNIYIGFPIQGTAPSAQTSNQEQAEPSAREDNVPNPGVWADCGRFVVWIFGLIYRQLRAGAQGAASRNVGNGGSREGVDSRAAIQDTVVENLIFEDTVVEPRNIGDPHADALRRKG